MMSNTILTAEAVADVLAAVWKAGLNGGEMLVPEGVEEIAPGAFAGRTELKCVKLPGTLRKIGAAAFYGCSNLEHVDLPKGLKEIGTAAFKNSGVTKIVIPPKVTQIESEAFADTPLTTAEIKCGCAGTAMFRACRRLRKLVIGERVRVLPEGMLQSCTALKTLVLPENLRKIERNVFRDCTSLGSISIPAQVTEIGAGAFYGCGIRKVILPADIRIIRWQTFGECRQLRMVYLPQAVTRVEAEAFYNCTALEKVCFEAELGKTIGLEIGEENTALLNASLRCGVQRAQFT